VVLPSIINSFNLEPCTLNKLLSFFLAKPNWSGGPCIVLFFFQSKSTIDRTVLASALRFPTLLPGCESRVRQYCKRQCPHIPDRKRFPQLQRPVLSHWSNRFIFDLHLNASMVQDSCQRINHAFVPDDFRCKIVKKPSPLPTSAKPCLDANQHLPNLFWIEPASPCDFFPREPPWQLKQLASSFSNSCFALLYLKPSLGGLAKE